MSTDALSLLSRRDIFAIGVIVSRKPYYIKNRQGQLRRVGYKLAIKTPYTYSYMGENIPIMISAFGRSDAWHTYRILEKMQAKIGVSGIRVATKVYESRGREKRRGVWIILSRTPLPNFLLIGGKM